MVYEGINLGGIFENRDPGGRRFKVPVHSGWKGVPKISILPIKFFSPKIVNF